MAESNAHVTRVRTRLHSVWPRRARPRLGLAVLLGVAAAAALGGEMWRYDATDIIAGSYSAVPSWAHPMGTDSVGHDVLALVLAGTRRSLVAGFVATAVATVAGAAIGAVSGFSRGWLDGLLMRGVDLVLSVPAIAVLTLLAVNAPTDNPAAVGAVIGALLCAPAARVVRGVVLSVRQRPYVEAARALGASRAWVLRKHVLPHAGGTVVVSATLTFAVAIVAEAALTYLGFGVQPPETSLGVLIAEGQTAVQTRPWVFFCPAVTLVVLELALSYTGDGLRAALPADGRSGDRALL